MVTLRKPLRRSATPPVTPHAVDLYRTCLKMLDDGVDRADRKFLDASLLLHRELQLRPWHPFVTDIDPDDDAPVDLDDMISRQRAHVLDLLRQLQAAVATSPRHGTAVIQAEGHH
jgi:hypothetical protein